jgi:hypothetical protein
MWTLIPAFFSGYSASVYKEVAEWSKLRVSQVVSVQVLRQADQGSGRTSLVIWYWKHVPDAEPKRAESALLAKFNRDMPDLSDLPKLSDHFLRVTRGEIEAEG